jgi:hypothetical protein
MQGLIQIRDGFIYVTERTTGKTYAIPKFFYGECAVMGGSLECLRFGNGLRTIEELIVTAKQTSSVDGKYIIGCGEFINIKKCLEAFGVFIEDDEILPYGIYRLIEWKCNYLTFRGKPIEYEKFIIPTEKWIAPTKMYTVMCSKESTIRINDKEYNVTDIVKRLEREGFAEEAPLTIDSNAIKTGSGKIFSPGFIIKLMESVVAKIEIPTKQREIVAFKYEGKRAFIMYSDFSVEYNDNYDSPHPVLPTTCSNIIIKLDDEKMTLNCAGKIRHIKYNEVLIRWQMSDKIIVMMLGTDEKFTEIIRVRNQYIDETKGELIDEKLLEKTRLSV